MTLANHRLLGRRSLLSRAAFGLMTLLALTTACTTGGTKPSDEIAFRATDSFDQSLAASLRAELPTVEVTFAQPVPANSPPDRFDKWMAAVERTGGRVQVVKTSGDGALPGLLLSLIPMIIPRLVELWDQISKQRMYASASGYDLRLYLNDDKETLQKAVFVRR